MKKIFDKIIGSSPSDCKKLIEEINKLGTALMFVVEEDHRTFETLTPNRGFFENPTPNENIRWLVRKISKEDNNINEKDDELGRTALYLCCKKGFVKIAKLLLENDADINLQNNQGFTPLMIACQENKIYIVKLLLEGKDCNVNLQSNNEFGKRTALMIACEKGYIEIVKLLLERKDVNVNLQTNNGWSWSALMISCQKEGKPEIVKLLLEIKDVNVNLQNNDGWSALMILFSSITYVNPPINYYRSDKIEKYKEKNPDKSSTEIDEYLNIKWDFLSAGEKLKYEDKTNQDELKNTNVINTIKLILQRKDVNLNLQNNDGETFLIMIINSLVIDSSIRLELIKLLLEKGANPHIKNNEGKTAIQESMGWGDDDMIKLLLNYCHEDHMKALEISVKERYIDATKIFDDIYRRKCIICDENQVDNLFNCGHAILCDECYTKLPTPKLCPLCRVPINDRYSNIETRSFQTDGKRKSKQKSSSIRKSSIRKSSIRKSSGKRSSRKSMSSRKQKRKSPRKRK